MKTRHGLLGLATLAAAGVCGYIALQPSSFRKQVDAALKNGTAEACLVEANKNYRPESAENGESRKGDVKCTVSLKYATLYFMNQKNLSDEIGRIDLGPSDELGVAGAHSSYMPDAPKMLLGSQNAAAYQQLLRNSIQTAATVEARVINVARAKTLTTCLSQAQSNGFYFNKDEAIACDIDSGFAYIGFKNPNSSSAMRKTALEDMARITLSSAGEFEAVKFQTPRHGVDDKSEPLNVPELTLQTYRTALKASLQHLQQK